MENKKSLISTVLLCGGLLLAACSIFCFFGSALKGSYEAMSGVIATSTVGSVFAFMFGGTVTAVTTAPGYDPFIVYNSFEIVPILIVTFIFVIIAVVLAVIAAIGLFTKKLDSKKVKILICAISVLMLVSAILALASKNSIISVMGSGTIPGTSLGGGIIAFAVLGFVSVAANVASIVLNRQPKAAA